jgi:hypothetical protein
MEIEPELGGELNFWDGQHLLQVDEPREIGYAPKRPFPEQVEHNL